MLKSESDQTSFDVSIESIAIQMDMFKILLQLEQKAVASGDYSIAQSFQEVCDQILLNAIDN